MGTLLQIFLLVNVFAIGALVVIGVRHAREHFAKDTTPIRKVADVRIPNAVREDLIHEAETRFRLATNANAKRLEEELAETAVLMAAEMKQLSETTLARQAQTGDVARQELERIGSEAVDAVRRNAAVDGDELKKVAAEAMVSLNAQLKVFGETRAAKITADIDAKLSDAVVSFLLESLGHDVDLGTQMKYVLARLEENKAAIKAEVKA